MLTVRVFKDGVLVADVSDGDRQADIRVPGVHVPGITRDTRKLGGEEAGDLHPMQSRRLQVLERQVEAKDLEIKELVEQREKTVAGIKDLEKSMAKFGAALIDSRDVIRKILAAWTPGTAIGGEVREELERLLRVYAGKEEPKKEGEGDPEPETFKVGVRDGEPVTVTKEEGEPAPEEAPPPDPVRIFPPGPDEEPPTEQPPFEEAPAPEPVEIPPPEVEVFKCSACRDVGEIDKIKKGQVVGTEPCPHCKGKRDAKG